MLDLKLRNRRLPLASDMALTPDETLQLEHVLSLEDAGSIADARKSKEGWPSLELVDVMEGTRLAYRLVLHPFGNGAVYEGTTKRVVVDIVQHGAEQRHGDPTLLAALEVAYERDRGAVGLVETITFAAPKAEATPVDDDAKLAALEARAAAGDELDDDDGDWLVGKIQRAVLRESGATRAVRRSELSAPLERLLRLLLSARDYAVGLLRELSLPNTKRSLAAFLGVGPIEGIDRDLTIEGHGTASILAFAREAVAGLVPVRAVLDAIAALSPTALEETLEQVVTERGHVLTKVAQKDDPLVFLGALTERLGKEGAPVLVRALARNEGNKLLAIRAWLTTQPTTIPSEVQSILADWAGGSPAMQDACAPVIAAVLARVPMSERAVLRIDEPLFTYTPGGEKSAGVLRVNAAMLAIARATHAPQLLESLAEMLARWDELQQFRATKGTKAPWGPPDPSYAQLLVDAGEAGRAAREAAITRFPHATRYLA